MRNGEERKKFEGMTRNIRQKRQEREKFGSRNAVVTRQCEIGRAKSSFLHGHKETT